MNRYQWIGVCVALLAALALSADYLLARMIARELPRILSDYVGRPVSLTNVKTSVLRLEAQADELIYGERSQPAVRFRQVTVGLYGKSLLSGTIELATGEAEAVELYTDRLRGRPESQTEDLDSVMRWMPDQMQFSEFNLLRGQTRLYTASDVSWEMLNETGRRMSWQETRGQRDVRIALTTESDRQIFALKGADLTFEVAFVGASEPIIAGHLASVHKDGAFDTVVEFQGSAFNGSLTFISDALFALPSSSRLDLEWLKLDAVRELYPLLSENSAIKRADLAAPDQAPEDFLQRALPALTLPDHRLSLSVGEVGIDDERVRNLVAEVMLRAAAGDQPPQIKISELRAELPRGDFSSSVTLNTGASWQAQLDAEIVTRSRQPEQLRGFQSTDWLWRSGEVSLTTRGGTLVELINNAKGKVDVEGVYQAAEEFPVSLKAHVDDSRGRIGADLIEFALGSSTLNGSIWIEEDPRKLLLRLHSDRFDMAPFLHRDPDETPPTATGLAIPDIGWWNSQLQVDARLTADLVTLPDVSFRALDLKFIRDVHGGQLAVSFGSDRTGHLFAQAQTIRNGRTRRLDMNVQLSGLNAPAVALDLEALVTGQLRLQGQGDSLAQLLRSVTSRLHGSIDFDKTHRKLSFAGNPTLEFSDDTIVGLHFAELQISNEQSPLATGSLSYDLAKALWQADIKAQKLDVDELLSVLPAPADEADEEDTLLTGLTWLPAIDFTATAESVRLFERDFSGFDLQLKSAPGEIELGKLSFDSTFGDVDGRGFLRSSDQNTQFELAADFNDLLFSELFEDHPLALLDAPLEGSARFNSAGVDWQALTANVRGALKLRNKTSVSAEETIDLDLEVQQQGRGFVAQLNDAQIGTSDLQGEVTFDPGQADNPPKLVARISSGFLDITPWQQLIAKDLLPVEEELLDPEGKEADSSTTAEPTSLFQLADNSIGVLRDLMNSPLRLLGFGTRADSESFFQRDPLPVAELADFDTDLDLSLTRLVADTSQAETVRFKGVIDSGKVTVDLSAEKLNGGPFKLNAEFQSLAQPPLLTVDAEMRDFHPENNPEFAPRSAFISLTGSGNSEAALAASLNGEVFVQSGAGLSDLAEFGLGFFTTDLLNEVGGLLFPGRERVPKLQCAVAFAKAENGIVVTPKAAVMQTEQANLLFRAEINLQKETIAAQFDSRSRTGAGVSVGNVLSNTVRIRGSLSKPTLVPHAAGIAWRSWAALATGGLSLLGESFLKRVLASERACDNLRQDIDELVCTGTTPAAKSSLVCPTRA